MVIMSTSISTQIRNQKAEKNIKKTDISSEQHSKQGTEPILDRRSCEKLHRKLGFPTRFT